MKIETARAKDLDVYIRDHPDQEVKEQKVPVELEGEPLYLPVWKIPATLLVYNIRNGRFAAELLSKEKELKRTLDPATREDALIIRQLLLDQSESETTALKENIAQYGQMEPGIITFDGAVINANRRMAVLSVLHEETSQAKFGYVKVGRLRKAVSQKDLWRIEAGLQFAKDFRLEYGPVNELLKLREGREQGLSDKEISAVLLGRYTKKQINTKLDTLKLIESYLAFIKQPGQYTLIQEERQVEKFNSLQAYVIAQLQTAVSKGDILRIITTAFSLIRGDQATHWDIRKLKPIALNPDAKKELFRKYDPDKPNATSAEELYQSFTVAKEVIQGKEEHDKPELLIRRALSNLKSVDPNSPKLADVELRELLEQLAQRVAALLKHSKR